LLIRGLLISAQGFLFIFLPAYVIAFFLRKWHEIDRSLFWLGALSLLVALWPTNFLLSLSRHLLPQVEAFWIPFMLILISSLLSGFFEEMSKWAVLRLKRVRGEDLLAGGTAVGLGAGFIAKVFLGIALVGAGMRLTFGDVSTATLREVAATPLAALSLQALASLADRLALLILNACLGFLVAQSILKGRKALFLYAVLIHAGFELIYGLIGLGLGQRVLLSNGLALLFDGGVAILAFQWLMRGLFMAETVSGRKMISQKET